ncbi:MAG: GNAT family N-acetyltransferase [Rhizobiaceae bacterium]|nr:GNAT family N-acetyltransferase [Rhizobiaceae bacterium]
MYWYLPLVWTMSFWDGWMNAAPLIAHPLGADDVDFAAELHSEAFARPWSGDEFLSLLSKPGSFGFVARRIGDRQGPPAGFVLARQAADEAEILTIAVSRKARRQGVGRLLMDSVLEKLHADRAASLFLEVDEDNLGALTLYRHLRFEEVGRRPAYYADASGRRTSALVLKRPLR